MAPDGLAPEPRGRRASVAHLPDADVEESKKKYGYSVPASAYEGGVWRLRPQKVMAWSSLPEDATRFVFPAV